MPLLLLGVLALVQFAVLAADHVAAQGVAAHAARAAAMDEGVEPALSTGSDTRLRITRRRVPGDTAEWVLVEVRLRSRALLPAGVRAEVVGRAAARVQ